MTTLPYKKEVTEEFYYDMLGAVPPAFHYSKGFLLGEAEYHTKDGEAAYSWFEVDGDKFYLIGTATVRQLETLNLK
jgi:hypothetical protein